MNTGNKNRTRSERVASLQLPPGTFERIGNAIRRPDVWLRISLCLATAVALWAITGAWAPRFAFRADQVPERDIVARVAFQTPDAQATKEKRDSEIRNARCIYSHDPQPLIDLRTTLTGRVFAVLDAESPDEASAVWSEFSFEPVAATTRFSAVETSALFTIQWSQVTCGQTVTVPSFSRLQDVFKQIEFVAFRNELAADPNLNSFNDALEHAFSPFENQGFFEEIEHTVDDGTLSEIRIYSIDDPARELRKVNVRDVRIQAASGLLRQRLRNELNSDVVADRVFAWLKPRLPTTLKYRAEMTRDAVNAAAEAIPPEMVSYNIGEMLAPGNKPLDAQAIELLKAEHETAVRNMTYGQCTMHSLSKFGLYFAMYSLCGLYSYYRRRRLLDDVAGLARLLLAVVFTVALCWFIPAGRWPAEVIPLLLFSMTVAIAYDQELALLLSAAMGLVGVLSLGLGLAEFVTVVAAMATTALMLRRLRSRTKLLYVALLAAVVGMLTAMGVETLTGEPWTLVLVGRIGRLGFCMIVAGLLMTGLLPFIERLFQVQTELSLLELGDVAHPLLQELVRRAPGTYNHSINVASIAEAAADAIGVNGLLVRVGAYFHDIGKMLKPGYFVENQIQEDNCHDQLLPAMSTLVIIAHVKDGADLARQHNLPKPIIDFILQHHGTTLVEYFYNQANKQSESNPDAGQVDEGSYRYPGPKPQTKEAAVLMLADSVESAGRTLVDPAPSRIESLIHELAMKKLLDGQFDECGLTLQELHQIEESLIKSLTGVYHGRIKYPGQQSA